MLKRSKRHSTLTSDSTLMVRRCINIYAYSLAKPVKHCLRTGKKSRFQGIGRRASNISTSFFQNKCE